MQSSIGFGMAVVAAPFLVLFAPELMPGALLVTSFSLPVVQLAHGPRLAPVLRHEHPRAARGRRRVGPMLDESCPAMAVI